MYSKLLNFFRKKTPDIPLKKDPPMGPRMESMPTQTENNTKVSKSELTPVDILMLHYAGGARASSIQFAGFWSYVYEVDPFDVLNKLISIGFIIKDYDIEANLISSTVADLKEVLKKAGLPMSGTKKVLISRLLNSLSASELQAHFPDDTYVLSETAKRKLGENDHIPFFHNHLSNSNITIFEADQLKKHNPSLNKFQIAYTLLNARKERNKLNNNWGLFRNDIHGISTIQYIEGQYLESLKNLFLVCFYDLSGMDNNFNFDYLYIFERGFFPYEKSIYTLAPGIISKINSLQKKINLNANDFSLLYFETIDPVEVPFHLFTKKETHEILLLEREKDVESLKLIYQSAKRRFAKSKLQINKGARPLV